MSTTTESSVIPTHVAIIMDGNSRWAKTVGESTAFGHQQGAKQIQPIAEACANAGVTHLTLFAFSTENWRRPAKEVKTLFDIMRQYLKDSGDELDRRSIRVHFMGDLSRFPKNLANALRRIQAQTRDNTRLVLNVALNYSGQSDVLRATKQLVRKVSNGELSVDQIDHNCFRSHLSSTNSPLPDFVIRTGNEYRLSNFMMWELAYSELYFSPKFWPEFTVTELHRALADYSRRQRRFGERSGIDELAVAS